MVADRITVGVNRTVGIESEKRDFEGKKRDGGGEEVK